jgi:hypothetical protein
VPEKWALNAWNCGVAKTRGVNSLVVGFEKVRSCGLDSEIFANVVSG